MALDQTTPVAGLAELYAALQDLPVKIERNALRGALRAGQKPILEEAKRLVATGAPSWTAAHKYGAVMGALKGSLRIKTSAKNGQVVATLTAGDKTTYYAHWVEFGTAAHAISAKPGHALPVGGGAYKTVQHPGARKRPFMRPAMDHAQAAGLEAFATYMQARIEREQLKVSGPDNY